jgi:phenylacetate-CoA ligase
VDFNWHNRVQAWLFMRQQRAKNTARYRAFVEFQKNQFLTPSEIERTNWEKRRRLLEYAFQTIPLYRARFQERGLCEKDFADPAVWPSIPLLTRKDVVVHFDDLKAPGLQEGDAYISTTGGQTGAPVKVLHDASYSPAALGWRMTQWWGVEPGSALGRIGRHGQGQARPGAKPKVRSGLFGRLPLEVRIGASQMSEASIRNFIREWNSVRPALLTGYVGAIHQMACFISQAGLRVHRPLAVQSTTAPLTSVVRAAIEAAFQAPVYDQYGACEVYWLAAECRCRRGLHMFADARHIEFVQEDGRPCPPDVYGRILVTDLENRSFPLIRYEIGDIGRRLSRPCACGVNLPLMDAVKSRLTDRIHAKDGSFVDGVFLTGLFDECPDAVRGFQVRQKPDYSVEIRIVPNPQHPRLAEVLSRVRAAVEEKVKFQVPVQIAQVGEIPVHRGKTRYVISEVPGALPVSEGTLSP